MNGRSTVVAVSPYEIIDFRSDNVIGGFGNAGEALAPLRRALPTYGPQAIADLSLMRIAEDDQFLVAMREDLERLVHGSELGGAPSAP
jgi:hypothetical protein